MRKLLRSIPVLLLVLGVMIAGIGGVGAQDQLTFSIVSHGGVGNPFWIVVIKGMEDACAILDADCAWLSDPVDNIDDMAGYWDDALARNNDGIGTTVPNPEVIRDGVNRAAEAGIPVIVLNTADPNAGTPDALPTLFYIGATSSSAAVPTLTPCWTPLTWLASKSPGASARFRKLDTVAWKPVALAFARSLKKRASR